MAELERMVTQKVQSLHERVKAKEDAFRVSPPSQAQLLHCHSPPCVDLPLHRSQLKRASYPTAMARWRSYLSAKSLHVHHGSFSARLAAEMSLLSGS